jgi:prophage antirepressor-like protein
MATTDLTIFEHEELGILRTTIIDGEPWFVALDVCKLLELSNISQTLVNLDEDEKGFIISDTLGGSQKIRIISEPGFYKLVLRSTKPKAKVAQRWVAHEVLPSIRKTGSYSMTPQITPRTKELLEEQKICGIKSLEKMAEMDIYPEGQKALFRAEAVSLVTGKKMVEYLPPVTDGQEKWLTPTDLAEGYGVSPQLIGKILKINGAHGTQDSKHKHSQPYWNKALHCERQVVSYKYDPDIVIPILDKELIVGE